MLLEFKQLNPCNLLDEILNNNVKIESLKHSGRNNTLLAETIWVSCNDEDVEKIKSIAENLDNSEIIKIEPTTQEQINAQLLEEIAQQKIVNAQLMQEIADLKGGSTNV